MPIKIRARVGRQAIRSTLDPSTAQYTRQIQQQIKEIEDALSEFADAVDDQAPEIIENALRPTFALSQKYTPGDTGKLKRSGFLDVHTHGKKTTATIGYGKGGKPPYAVLVHELTELKHADPTRAKFLQSALEEDFHQIQKRLVDGFTPER